MTFKLHVIGPNLAGDPEFTFHVHSEGCADVTRSRMYRSPEFEYDRKNTIEVSGMRDLEEYVYADQLAEGSMEPGDSYSEYKIFPCVPTEFDDQTVPCGVFLLCDRNAVTTIDGGPIGPVPACQRCADKIAIISA